MWASARPGLLVITLGVRLAADGFTEFEDSCIGGIGAAGFGWGRALPSRGLKVSATGKQPAGSS